MSIQIITNKQQLKFIQDAIRIAIDASPRLALEVDEFDEPMGQILVEMIQDTLDDPKADDAIHGFVL